jgi:hypothetical protein
MSLIGEINDFFNRWGEHFDLKTINYTKQIVHKIKSSPVLESFLRENNITSYLLLNEITPYSQYKLIQNGDERLDMKEIQSILNIILFSNEMEKMILEDHVHFSSIGPVGELYYLADEYATEYFNNKYGIEIVLGEEFDYTILDDNQGGDYFSGFGIN